MASTEGPSSAGGAPHGAGGSASGGAARPGIGELLHRVSDQVQALVRGEIELAKAKASRTLKVSGLGAGLLGAGLIMAVFLVGWVLHTIEIALSHALPNWAAALIVTGLLLILTVMLILIGIDRLQHGLKSLPHPQQGVRADVEALKKGLGR